MTPFGARLRALRADRGLTLKDLAEGLQVSAAYLSALEHGKRGAPSAGLVHQVNEYFGLIWDEADDLARLARLSNPRVTVNTAGLTPEQTALANRVAQMIHRLPPKASPLCMRSWMPQSSNQNRACDDPRCQRRGVGRERDRA